MRFAIFAALAFAVLAALWVGLRPSPVPVSGPAPAATSVAPAPAAEVPTAVQRFVLSAPRPVGVPPEVLRVEAGDTVEITVTSAGDDELHLHGYDLAVDLQGGVPGTLRFVAGHAGRFEIELHRGHAEIAVLEVLPR